MTTRSVIVGTAGHIDHGKTSLVHALTGVDTDRLPEEKRRGITVDLGFASTEVETAGGERLCLSFVDVPGHKLFVRNMLAGASGIDCVVLVISAEDGVMPQTEEHLSICRFLGITRGLTVITKADLAPKDWLDEMRAEIARFLRPSFLHEAPVLAVSAHTGQGMEQLRAALAELVSEVPARSNSGSPRLPLDRAFVMKGFGTVVTGTLQSGALLAGQALVIEPGGVTTRARTVQMRGHSAPQAPAGSRVAVNLPGIEVADAPRGSTLVAPDSFGAVDAIDAELTLLADAADLRHRARVRFHAFTAEAVAAASIYGYLSIAAGGSGLARLRLAHPVVLLPGDRFVLRQLSPARTIGGGRVLDAHPMPGTRKRITMEWLQAMRQAPPDQQLLLRVRRRGMQGLTPDALVRELGWPQEEVRAATHRLTGEGALLSFGAGLLLSSEGLFTATAALLACMDRKRAKAAGAPGKGRLLRDEGLTRAELRTSTALPGEVVAAAMDVLLREGKLQEEGERLFRSGAGPGRDSGDEAILERIVASYKAADLAPPLLVDVARTLVLGEPDARRLLTLLLRKGALIKLGQKTSQDDLFFHPAALAALRARMQTLRGQTLDVAGFKHQTGLSRKYAIPLLEYLDREHVTQKQGESRKVL